MKSLISAAKEKRIGTKDFQESAIKILGVDRYEELIRRPAAQQLQNFTLGAARAGEDESTASDRRAADETDLQDVLGYANIDLRAEAELSMAQADSASSIGMFASPSGLSQNAYAPDARASPFFYCNPGRLRYIASGIAARVSSSLKAVDEEALAMIAAGLRCRMTEILAACIENSRHRVDRGRAAWRIRILNDPRKQIGMLEQVLRLQEEKLKASGETLAATAGADAGKPEGSTAKPAKKAKSEPETAAVRSRITNTTVMQVTGMKKKDWMLEAQSVAKTVDESVNEGTIDGADVYRSAGPTIPNFAAAPTLTPLVDRQLVSQYTSRMISGRDLLAIIDMDPRLARSQIALLLHDMLNTASE